MIKNTRNFKQHIRMDYSVKSIYNDTLAKICTAHCVQTTRRETLVIFW